MNKKTDETDKIEIKLITMKRVTVSVVGYSPLIMHRMAPKVMRELLYGRNFKNSAALAGTLKHDPLEEFQDALYKTRDLAAATAIHLPGGSFAAALSSVATDIPGAARAQIQRLTSVTDVNVQIYGVPTLRMDMVRQGGISRTPDIRTRPHFEQWCAIFTIEYFGNLLNENTVVNLLAAAGRLRGVGEWRPEKGGQFGKFDVCGPKDPLRELIMKNGGKKQQLAAIAQPQFNDPDTEQLFKWHEQDRQRKAPESKRRRKPAAQIVPNIVDEETAMSTLKRGKGNGARAPKQGQTTND